jgi:hypothetical protein
MSAEDAFKILDQLNLQRQATRRDLGRARTRTVHRRSRAVDHQDHRTEAGLDPGPHHRDPGSPRWQGQLRTWRGDPIPPGRHPVRVSREAPMRRHAILGATARHVPPRYGRCCGCAVAWWLMAEADTGVVEATTCPAVAAPGALTESETAHPTDRDVWLPGDRLAAIEAAPSPWTPRRAAAHHSRDTQGDAGTGGA